MNTSPWPTLGYRDAPAAIRFLIDAFGFEEVTVYEGDAKGSVGHAVLRLPGGGIVNVHSADAMGPSVADLSTIASAKEAYPPFSVHVETSDPDALFRRAVAAGARVIRHLEDSPYGTRGFVVSDPEGLYWSVGTPLPLLVRDSLGEWRPAPKTSVAKARSTSRSRPRGRVVRNR